MDFAKISNATILYGNLETIELQEPYLNQTDYLIHIATTWCGSQCNIIDAPIKMLDMLDVSRIKKVFFFSTASILGKNNTLLQEAETLGTSYIKDKYKSYMNIKASKYKDLVTHIFPTVIIGGDNTHHYTHIGEGLLNIKKQINWLKYFYVDLGFHYIHAQDIAKVLIYFLENKTDNLDYVLGNQYTTLKKLIKQVANYFGKKVFLQILIPTPLLDFIIKVFRLKVDPWGLFSLNYRHFEYTTVNCQTYNLPSNLLQISDIMKSLENQAFPTPPGATSKERI